MSNDVAVQDGHNYFCLLKIHLKMSKSTLRSPRLKKLRFLLASTWFSRKVMLGDDNEDPAKRRTQKWTLFWRAPLSCSLLPSVSRQNVCLCLINSQRYKFLEQRFIFFKKKNPLDGYVLLVFDSCLPILFFQ